MVIPIRIGLEAAPFAEYDGDIQPLLHPARLGKQRRHAVDARVFIHRRVGDDIIGVRGLGKALVTLAADGHFARGARNGEV